VAGEVVAGDMVPGGAVPGGAVPGDEPGGRPALCGGVSYNCVRMHFASLCTP
jgi:hypothetical protein